MLIIVNNQLVFVFTLIDCHGLAEIPITVSSSSISLKFTLQAIQLEIDNLNTSKAAGIEQIGNKMF